MNNLHVISICSSLTIPRSAFHCSWSPFNPPPPPLPTPFPIYTAVMRQWDAGQPENLRREIQPRRSHDIWSLPESGALASARVNRKPHPSDAARYLSVFSSNRFILLHFHGAVNRQRLRVPAPAVAPQSGAQWNYICLEGSQAAAHKPPKNTQEIMFQQLKKGIQAKSRNISRK